MGFYLNRLDLKRVFGVFAVLALAGLASCNSDDDFVAQSKEQQPQAPVYNVSIPAQRGMIPALRLWCLMGRAV